MAGGRRYQQVGRKPGRPKLPRENRTKAVSLRFRPREFEMLKNYARDTGETVSVMARKAVMRRVVS